MHDGNNQLRLHFLEDFDIPKPLVREIEVAADSNLDGKKGNKKDGQKVPAASPDVKDKSLPYEPFDAKKMLWKIKNLSETDNREEWMSHYRQCLEHQEDGIAVVIRLLQNTVESTPDAGVEQLLDIINSRASNYGFTSEQLQHFCIAIGKYLQRHQAVEKYRALYPVDADLFEACFEKRPVGRVEVIKDPMTLYFRCFHTEDFNTAATYYLGNDTTKREQAVDLYKQAGGFALHTVHIPELTGTVAIERAEESATVNESNAIITELSEAIHHRDCSLDIDNQEGDIAIDVHGVGTWTVHMAQRDAEGKPLVIEIQPPATEGIVAIIERKNIQSLPATAGDTAQAPHAATGAPVSSEVLYLMLGDREYGRVEINHTSIAIHDDSADGSTIRYREKLYQAEITDNTERSDRIRKHENAHQYNKLFVPPEWQEGETQISSAVEHAETPETAIGNLLRKMIRKKRKILGMDTWARDEILAYYKDGTQPPDIFNTLATSPLYNYRGQLTDKINEIPAEIKAVVRENILDARYKVWKNGKTFRGSTPLELDDAVIAPEIDAVFHAEYIRDLKQWTRAITMLEMKGYSRDEILSRLGNKPAKSWEKIALRRKSKNPGYWSSSDNAAQLRALKLMESIRQRSA